MLLILYYQKEEINQVISIFNDKETANKVAKLYWEKLEGSMKPYKE